MADVYSSSLVMNVSPRVVFDYLSDVENMPSYLPTVHTATMPEPETVHMTGEAHGHPYEGEGYLKKDEDALTLSWGSEYNNDYSGKFSVEEVGQDRSEVSIEIRFAAKQGAEKDYEEQMAQRRDGLQQGLDEALKNIKARVENGRY